MAICVQKSYGELINPYPPNDLNFIVHRKVPCIDELASVAVSPDGKDIVIVYTNTQKV